VRKLKYRVIFYYTQQWFWGHSGHLVGVFPFTEWLYDYLINFMNNTYSLSPPLFHFSLITTPSPSHIHFSLPVLKLITVKKIFVLKQLEVAVSWLDHSDVFFGLHYS
jgi:hypothetical protein